MEMDVVAIATGDTSLAYPLLPQTLWPLTAIPDEDLSKNYIHQYQCAFAFLAKIHVHVSKCMYMYIHVG